MCRVTPLPLARCSYTKITANLPNFTRHREWTEGELQDPPLVLLEETAGSLTRTTENIVTQF